MKLYISEGYAYQKVDGLVEVTDKSFSQYLISLALKSQCFVITKDDAISMGFAELANWSTPDDRLVYINGCILLCCKENDIKV